MVAPQRLGTNFFNGEKEALMWVYYYDHPVDGSGECEGIARAARKQISLPPR